MSPRGVALAVVPLLAVCLVRSIGACGSFEAAGPGGAGTSARGASCMELRGSGATADGIFTLALADGADVEAYCDMTTDGGGWTLVARTGADGVVFGWLVSTGGVRDDTRPYSLDARRLAPFKEILFGARGEGKSWSQPVYTRSLPANFLADHKDAVASAAGSVAVAGCTTAPSKEQPTMLSHVGLPAATTHFVFTDDPNNTTFGLWPEGWYTNGTGSGSCDYDGKLTDLPGMIFVR